MNALLAVVRFAHLLVAISLFGGFVFLLAIGGPAKRVDAHGNALEWARLSRRLRSVAWWSLGTAVVSAAAWLALEGALVSGLPFIDATSGDVLGRVAMETTFGRAWLWRFAVAIALAVVMLYETRRSMAPRRMLLIAATMLAAIYLATIAFAGHAAAGQGADRFVRIGTDGAHLLAAGAWIGALPGLVLLLAGARRVAAVASIDVAARAARCFSWLGIASVGVLVVSGIVNAWYLVRDVPHLIGTGYGQLLLFKVALFVAILALAAINRVRLTPRVATRDFVALHKLLRNATLETIIGIAVVAIVAVLGITVPAAHQESSWPLSFTFQVESVDTAAAGWLVAVIVTVACAAGALIIALRRRAHPSAVLISSAALVVLVAAAVTCPYLSIVPAYPTTYAESPVAYTTSAIVRGAVVYADNCAQCHGPGGHGDGPLAVSLAPKPVDLVVHAVHHSAGDMFWWIAHGIPGTAMPPFGKRISDAKIWSAIQFLRAQSAASDARQLTTHVAPWRPLVAPDFTFEVGSQGQESLKGQRGRSAVLLVLYSIPQSLDRLRALAADEDRLSKAGLRVVAISASPAEQIAEQRASDPNSIIALADPDVAATYAMFATKDDANGRLVTPSHVEFLIDRAGYLRARWLGVPAENSKQTTAITDDIAQLNEEPPREAAPEAHMH